MGLDVTLLSQDMCTLDPDDTRSYLNWGKLVKTWATGVNQFNDNKDYSIPSTAETLRPVGVMTKDQFQAMLANANVSMTIPDRVTKFVFVQDDSSTVIVRIPVKKVVEDVQRLLEGLVSGPLAAGDPPRRSYPFPKFYADVFQGIPNPTATNKEGLLKMHCIRIGEYTINTCG